VDHLQSWSKGDARMQRGGGHLSAISLSKCVTVSVCKSLGSIDVVSTVYKQPISDLHPAVPLLAIIKAVCLY
jgi:hypothetical protein